MPNETQSYSYSAVEAAAPHRDSASAFQHWLREASRSVDRLGSRVPPFAFVIAITIIMILAIACSRGGYDHQELQQYIPHYLSHKPLLEKIFDYKKVEIWQDFRPRPLSYIVDNYDVAFIGWSARHGFPHLLSASYYVFWALDCLLLWFYFRRRLEIHAFTAGLFLCLLSADPVFFSHSNYFRSAKPGGAFLLLAAFLVFVECFRAALDGRSRLRCFLLASGAGVLLFCACLFDEIPAAFTFAAAVMLAVEWFWDRKSPRARAWLYPLATVIAVLAAFVYYDLFLHRWLIWTFAHERVSMAYQTGTAGAMLWHPGVLLAGTLSVFVDVFGHLTGAVPTVIAAVFMLACIAAWIRPAAGIEQDNDRFSRFLTLPRFRPLIRILLAGLLMFGCLYGMIARHHGIMRLDVRLSTYVLPLTIVFLLFVAATVAMVIHQRHTSRGVVQLILVVLVASSLVSVLSRRIFTHGDLRTHMLLISLRDPSAFDAQARENSDTARLQHEVLNSPVYKALRSQMQESSDGR